MAGCQAPAAHPTACDPGVQGIPRNTVLARQLAADTAMEIAYHPLRSGWAVLSEPMAFARAAAAEGGIIHVRMGMSLRGKPDPVPPCRPSLDPEVLEKELQRLGAGELRPASVQLHLDGGEALAALESVIAQATCRIDVFMYLWDSDPLGKRVAARLAASASPALRVRVLVDGGGNLIHGQPKQAPADELNQVVCWLARQPYVEVVRTRDPFLRFDHRKLVVVDGRLAWSGGRNFTRPAFFEDRDLSYTLAGPLAAEMETIFEEFWQAQGGVAASGLPPPPDPPANAYARLVRTLPTQRSLAQALYQAVDQARHHVYVENPYLSDSLLQVKLAQARARGADVRVVLTVQDDSAVVNLTNRVTVNRLLRTGIRVYLYPGMTHVKATSVDGRWAYLGTGNFDALSLRHNRELGLAVSSGPLIDELEARLFLPDLRPEWEVTAPLPVQTYEQFFAIFTSLCL